MINIVSKYNLQDPAAKKCLKEIEDELNKILEFTGNRYMNKDVSDKELKDAKQGEILIDEKNGRLVTKINGKFFATDLSQLW